MCNCCLFCTTPSSEHFFPTPELALPCRAVGRRFRSPPPHRHRGPFGAQGRSERWDSPCPGLREAEGNAGLGELSFFFCQWLLALIDFSFILVFCFFPFLHYQTCFPESKQKCYVYLPSNSGRWFLVQQSHVYHYSWLCEAS